MMHTRRHLLARSWVAGLALAISCVGSGVEPPQPAEPLVWPPPPAQPRIKFVRIISRPEDMGITRGVFQRLGKLFTGGSQRHLVRPMAVVVTIQGVLYVADPGSKGIHRFDPEKGDYDFIRAREGGPLPSPVGLAAGPNGEVYVADSLLGQVLVITPGAEAAVTFPLKAKVQQPTAIALDPAVGRLYVVDTGDHQVEVFGMDGTHQATFGRRGAGDGELNYPTAIWRDSAERLLITDALNFRVQIFDGGGRFQGKFGQLGDATGDLSRPKGVATDRFGHIYVVDALFHTVQIFKPSGDFLLSFGTQGQAPGEFWLPTGIFIGKNDTIYVADSHNKRIQVFRYIGDGS